MLYIKKLSLVAALTVASIVWLPLLASRGMLATLNWCGRGLMAGLRSKDSGVKLVSALGLAFFGLPWLAAIGIILALASYEVAVFRLMQSLFKVEDIGFRPGDKPKGPTTEPTGAPPVQPRLPKVIQFPTSSAQLSAPPGAGGRQAARLGPRCDGLLVVEPVSVLAQPRRSARP